MQNSGQNMMLPLTRHPHWPHVLYVIERLTQAGFIAWLAGGCVRDGLLGRTPSDFDIATDATPDQIEQLFEKSVDVGRAFGVMLIPSDKGVGVEVATFRSDGDYKDGRHPETIRFDSPKEDALRRDFTINALFLDISTLQIHDYVDGKADLKAGLIRCVGDPKKRFQEDKLRPLRAVRFAAQLNFKIEGATWHAIQDVAPLISVVSKERVNQELNKLMISKNRAQGFRKLLESQLAQEIFPDLPVEKSFPILEIPLKQLQVEPLWTAFFISLYGISEEAQTKAKDWLYEYKFSNQQMRTVISLMQAVLIFESSEISLGQKLLQLDKTENVQALDVWLWFRQSQNQDREPVHALRSEFCKRMTHTGHLPKALVTGKDLLNLGIKKGPRLGILLKDVYNYQIENQICNKQKLLSYVEQTSREV